MARKELTTPQKSALAEVRQANMARQARRATIETEIRARVNEEVAALDMSVALAVRKARQLDISITRIGEEGLGTRDPHTPRRFLAMTESTQAALDEHADELLLRWIDDEHTTIAVNIPDFEDVWEHEERRAADWPNPMRGVAQRDPEGADPRARRSGWIVTEDPAGARGWFTEMVQARAHTIEGTLPNILNTWAEANS
jgi:hypothetical protein